MTEAVVAAKPDAVRAEASFTETLVKPVRQWLAWRSTMTDLRGLNRRHLADIGVEADIEGFAWDMAGRR